MFEPKFESRLRGIFGKKDKETNQKPQNVLPLPLPPLTERPTGQIRKNRQGERRYIFREWPLDRSGPNVPIEPTGMTGKTTPNGILWGETLFNFYYCFKIHSIPNYMTFTTSSVMATWCKSVGQTYAEFDLDFAEKEDNPRLIEPCDIRQSIKDFERFPIGQMMEESSTDEIPPESPFVHRVPFVPFSAPCPPLQKRIPYYLLPERLVVHDPYDVLRVSGRHDHREPDDKDDEDSTSKKGETTSGKSSKRNSRFAKLDKESIHIYDLALSDDTKTTISKKREELLSDQKQGTEPKSSLLFAEGTEPGEVPYAIQVPAPPPPSPLLSIPEAHLYISPSECVGEGHHSFAYNVELELPKTLFYDPEICPSCVLEDVDKIMEDEDKLFWKQFDSDIMCREETDTPHGTRERTVYNLGADFQHHLDAQYNFDGQGTSLTLSEPTPIDFHCSALPKPVFGQKDKGTFDINLEVVRNAVDMELVPSEDRDAKPGTYESVEAYPSIKKTSMTYQGPARFYPVAVQYQHPYSPTQKCCKHAQKTHPLTARVRVVAKLSKEYDDHLEREAENYQKFPQHLFEHWSGYNLVRPIKAPVPVGAVVPQFYGYYKPKNADERYLSPILLLENCGVPVKVADLNPDECNECISLFLRFHDADWCHGSVYERNIVWQKGAVSDFPLFKNPDTKSFRLIDFGRSTRDCATNEYILEKGTACQLFHDYPW